MTMRPVDGLVLEEINAELCLMRIDTNEVLVLNGTATDVWLLISGGIDSSDLVAKMASSYATTAEQIRDDVEAVMAEFRLRGFVVDDQARG